MAFLFFSGRMRTTLKRGLGRGAAVNGNGRAVFPPGVPTAVTRYRQPPRRRAGLYFAAKIVGGALATLLMLAASLVGGIYLFFHESIADVQARTPEIKLAQRQLDVAPPPERPAIALVIGYDRRPEEHGLPARSDTVMLLRADPETETISMLSFPRDLQVEVRCPGGSFVGRINSAFAECQDQGTLATVRALTGLPVNYLIKVNFRGFREVVDRLGGVWMDVDRRYFNDNDGRTYGTYETIDLRPGYQKLNGWDALDFVRYRHTDSDVHRLARQQAFVRAVKERVAERFAPTTLPRLVGAVTSNVEVGQGGGQDIPPKTVLGYAFFAYKLPGGHLFQVRIEDVQDIGGPLVASTSSIQQAVHEFVNPDVEAPKKATAAALGRKFRPSGPRPREVSVTVLNGNGVPGAAANAAEQLRARGYQIRVPPSGAPGNAPSWDYERTKVYFDPAQARSRAAARRLADVFGAADVERMPRVITRRSNAAMVVVTVGATFRGSLEGAEVDRTPPRQPPAVYHNPSATAPLLRRERRKLPFRLQVPTLLERTSSLDDEMGIRRYKIEDHATLRLTFQTAANEYWGIQQTDWDDAPVLAGRSVRQVIRGRTYDLYYAGSDLHMVVLRSGGATYWVVNTLLNSLSNETMLAIARGLRPLPGKVG